MSALVSKPGITNASSLAIPKNWDAAWFRSFINNQLTGADVRNAVGSNGIKVSGNLASPYGTISISGLGFTLDTPTSGSTAVSGTGTFSGGAIQMGDGFFAVSGATPYMAGNLYYSDAAGNYIYERSTITATLYAQNNNSSIGHQWYSAPGGTAGTAATLTELMRLTVAGTLILGAGTNGYVPTYFGGSPGFVTAASQNQSFVNFMRFDSSVFGPSLGLSKSRSNTIGVSSAVQAGDSVGDVVFLGADGSNGWPVACRIIGLAEAAATAGSLVGDMQFLVGVGASAAEICRMRGGDGVSYFFSTVQPTFVASTFAGNQRALIQLNGKVDAMIDFTAAGAFRGYIYQSGTTNELRMLSESSLTGYTNGGTLAYTWDSNTRLSHRGASLSPTGTTHAVSLNMTGASTEYGLVINSTNANTLSSTHFITFGDQGTESGKIQQGASTSTCLYTTSSDYRLKSNVVTLDHNVGMQILSQLRPVSFTWTKDNINDIGFIAHEVQAVVPQAVGGLKDAVNDDGSIRPQGLDLSKLIPWIVAALQSHDAQLQTANAQIAAYQTQIATLQAQVATVSPAAPATPTP